MGLLEHHLMAIQQGTPAYVGIEVRPAFIAWQPAHVSMEQRKECLRAFWQRLLGIVKGSLDGFALNNSIIAYKQKLI